MSRSPIALPKIAAALAAAILIAAVAGCGSGSSDSESESTSAGAYGGGSAKSESAYGGGGSAKEASSKSASTATGASSGAGAVSTANVPKLGRVLVDSRGFTLYDFHKDQGTQSSCYGACAAAWPPLTTSGSPQATEGAMASNLGTTKRNDGTMQVTYAGHPLYTFTGDTKPGEANGNDITAFGGEWYALQPNGQEPED
jgi:predicted lipoprotein with Yx(FWY)xxD motif